MRRLLPILAASLAAATPAAAQDADPAPVSDAPVVGQPMPDLVLPTVDGARTVALSQFRGRKVLLLVFASW